MQAKEIKIILNLIDESQDDVAAAIKVNKSDLSATITGTRPRASVRRKLADHIAEAVRKRILESPEPATVGS